MSGKHCIAKGMSWGGEPAANLTDGYLQPGLFDIYTEIPAAHLIRTGVVKQDANGEIHLYNKFGIGKLTTEQFLLY